jgi:XTP/dITP diphosphohydrolase
MRVDRPDRILLATTNRGKLREVVQVLGDLPVDFVTLADVPDLPIPHETGSTFSENADLKAWHYARLSGLWALADDSGLEVDALGGAPGIYSARFAGPDAADARNNARLIRLLAEISPDRRTARFRCFLALANSTGILARAAGTVEGIILDHPRGQNGFGYDPLFFLPNPGLTMAELSPDEKGRISHRGNALRSMRSTIETFFE